MDPSEGKLISMSDPSGRGLVVKNVSS